MAGVLFLRSQVCYSVVSSRTCDPFCTEQWTYPLFERLNLLVGKPEFVIAGEGNEVDRFRIYPVTIDLPVSNTVKFCMNILLLYTGDYTLVT